MYKKVFSLFFVCLLVASTASGGDLYRVWVQSQTDAARLVEIGVEPVLLLNDGYLVIGDAEQIKRLRNSDLKYNRLAVNVSKDQLALDNRRDRKNVDKFSLLFEQDQMRLFQVTGPKLRITEDGTSLIPLRNDFLKIAYKDPKSFSENGITSIDGLLELIDGVKIDTVIEYLYHLQAFDGRLTGTASSRASRDWIYDQFLSYGYTNVIKRAFTGQQLYDYNPVTSYNVIATKTGSRFPNRQIVIGAHYDAVPGSPGADDNGSGTTGVLEIARVLADIETDMTIIFVTFDSEESGLHGSWDYASRAAAFNDSIICMLNMDMIGNIGNDYYADLHYGPERAYAKIWDYLADSLVNIDGLMAGASGNSDHAPFVQNGFDVAYASEYIFSSVYHSYQDSTTYINFNYMTRMIKAVLATAYTIDQAPMPVTVTSVRDVGDGQSLQVEWVASDPGNVEALIVYYDTDPATALDSLEVPSTSTSAIIEGLTLGQQYQAWVLTENDMGRRSVVYTSGYGTPYVLPVIPEGFTADPHYHAIELHWVGNNTELDFSHYTIVRDGEVLPYNISGTSYIDNDFSLGSDFHSYLIVAVDVDGNISDTVGVQSVSMRAAVFEPGRILAVNRSGMQSSLIVDEVLTGEFMRDALDGMNYDYYSDTASSQSSRGDTLNLIDLLDYELLIIGGESGRNDDIGSEAIYGGILDTITHYMSIGGKVIIFGRWGELFTGGSPVNYNYFNYGQSDYAYKSFFHMTYRGQILTLFNQTTLTSDFIGAHSQEAGYPDLVWDSAASVAHSSPWVEVTGIPCPTITSLQSPPETIYTYDSRSNTPLTEGKPVGWKYFGEDYQYIFFEIPFSFIERSSAKAALQMAVSELISSGPAAVTIIDPDTLSFETGIPSAVDIYLGDLGASQIPGDINVGSILVNNSVTAISGTVLGSHPDFTGEVLEVSLSGLGFTDSYGQIVDTVEKTYTVSWQYNGDARTYMTSGRVVLIGKAFVEGDANGDGNVNLGDASHLINYIFYDGSAPEPLEAGDANCDGSTNLGDAGHIINYIFYDGPAPGC